MTEHRKPIEVATKSGNVIVSTVNTRLIANRFEDLERKAVFLEPFLVNQFGTLAVRVGFYAYITLGYYAKPNGKDTYRNFTVLSQALKDLTDFGIPNDDYLSYNSKYGVPFVAEKAYQLKELVSAKKEHNREAKFCTFNSVIDCKKGTIGFRFNINKDKKMDMAFLANPYDGGKKLFPSIEEAFNYLAKKNVGLAYEGRFK